MVEESQKRSESGRRRVWLIAPALAGVYPVLVLYGKSTRDVNVSDAVVCSIIVAAIAVALVFALRPIFSTGARASLAAVLFMIWVFGFSSFARVGRYPLEAISSSKFNDYFLYGIWFVVLWPALWWLFRLRWSERRTERVYGFVLLACIGSIGFAFVQAAHAYLEDNRPTVSSKPIWDDDRAVLPPAWKPRATAPRRDVYYLVFDRYGNEDTLRRYFEFDDSEFFDGLEKRGFIVDRKARTSYPMTMPSMASTLNMRYLRPYFENLSDYYSAVESNAVGKLMIAAGYKYFYFGNQYEPLRKSAIAQWNMKISMLPSEFADALVSMTPFRPIVGRQHKRQFVLNKFAEVANLAQKPEATFAYSHFLVPHPPYAFARDGSAQLEINRATRPERELYIDQLVATNRLILDLVDRLKRESPIEPIIIIQSDEGPYLMPGDESLSREDQIAKRTGILNAIYIPDDAIRAKLPKPFMPVNTFRFLFKEYFGAPLEMLPERIYYWEKAETIGVAESGTRMVDVTKEFSASK